MQSGQIESPVEVHAVHEWLRDSVRGVIVGKDRVVDLCLIALLAATERLKEAQTIRS